MTATPGSPDHPDHPDQDHQDHQDGQDSRNGQMGAVQIACHAGRSRYQLPATPGTTAGAGPVDPPRAAVERALAAGWVQRVDGFWLCPAHAGSYAQHNPTRFTLGECRHRHRIRQPH